VSEANPDEVVRYPLQSAALRETASDSCLAAARSRRGSDMPPACHSLPRRRFATPRGKPLIGKQKAAGMTEGSDATTHRSRRGERSGPIPPPRSARHLPFAKGGFGDALTASAANKKAAGIFPATVFLASVPCGSPSAELSRTSSVFWLAHLGPRGPASVLQPSQVSPMTGSLHGERTPAPTATGYAADLGLRPAPPFLITAPALRQSGRVTRCSICLYLYYRASACVCQEGEAIGFPLRGGEI